MIAELEKRQAKGLGGSTYYYAEAGVAAAVPIVGSTIPIGTEIAWAENC